MNVTNGQTIKSSRDIELLKPRTEAEIMSTWTNASNVVVSCCAITFNHQDFVEFALKSMLMQITDFAFEIIIRDDASTDNTPDIIKQYQKRYPNIIKPILESENGYKRGLRPRMIVMNQAKGEYIAPLDCDDYWTRVDKLQRQVDFLRNNSEYALCFHNAVVVDSKDQIIKEECFLYAKDFSSEDLIVGRTTILPSFSVFKNIGFDASFPPEFDGAKNGDTITWHLVGFYGGCKYIDDFNAGAFRVHAQGQNTGLTNFIKIKNRIETRFAIVQRLRKLNQREMEAIGFQVMSEFSIDYLCGLIRSSDVKGFTKTFSYFPRLFGFRLPVIILSATAKAVVMKFSKTVLRKCT